MLNFSVFAMAFGMVPPKLHFICHNFSYWIPILTWDTSMSLWLNSLIFYI